jgi:hypothetical protein
MLQKAYMFLKLFFFFFFFFFFFQNKDQRLHYCINVEKACPCLSFLSHFPRIKYRFKLYPSLYEIVYILVVIGI